MGDFVATGQEEQRLIVGMRTLSMVTPLGGLRGVKLADRSAIKETNRASRGDM